MKINKINSTDYKIYFFKEILTTELKDKVLCLKNILNLEGFYKLLFHNNKLGCFMELIKLDDSFYKNTLDLKIEEVKYNIYFKTKDYFIVEDCAIVKYYDGFYYGLVDDSFDEILEKVEFGEFVFGYDISSIINKCYTI